MLGEGVMAGDIWWDNYLWGVVKGKCGKRINGGRCH